MTAGQPFEAMARLLHHAYSPCENFGTCKEAVWDPKRGHIPRGVCGATGCPEDVRVVMVFAEPGNPQPEEVYLEHASAQQFLRQTTQTAYDCFSSGRDLFHRNVRWFISQIFPGMAFAETLKHVWLTEGRLCSFAEEIGGRTDSTCAQHFLGRQISLLPNATVVGFGGKAKKYLSASRIPHVGALALAPPGCNFKTARPSWDAAVEQVRARL